MYEVRYLRLTRALITDCYWNNKEGDTYPSRCEIVTHFRVFPSNCETRSLYSPQRFRELTLLLLFITLCLSVLVLSEVRSFDGMFRNWWGIFSFFFKYSQIILFAYILWVDYKRCVILNVNQICVLNVT